jgi:adenine phosphoribosyltransferase
VFKNIELNDIRFAGCTRGTSAEWKAIGIVLEFLQLTREDGGPCGESASVGETTLKKSSDKAEDPRFSYASSLIRTVPDFPKKGVRFKDITPLLSDPKAFHIVIDELTERFVGEHIDAVAGIESRGFIFGGALAARLNASFVPLRKPGKLPGETDCVSYNLEYGSASLEIHVDSMESGANVVIVDDLLATGGTAAAAGELIRRQGGYIVAYAFVIELDFLGGRDKLQDSKVLSLIHYGAND